jgi:DNA replication ATP-dependent helicase Dna2
MNQELTDWPSRTFYEGKIRPAAQAAGRRLPLKPVETPWDFALAPEQPLVFLDLDHRNNTIRSRWEADVVVELVQALIKGAPAARNQWWCLAASGRAIRNG